MAKQEIFLEEAVLDDLAHDFSSLELPLSERAFKLIGWLVFLAIIVVISKLFLLGWKKNAFYTGKALANASIITTLHPERGIIFDRFGKPLTRNTPSFRISIRLAEFLKENENVYDALDLLESILSLPTGYIGDLLKNINLEKDNYLTVAREINVDQVIKIKNLNLGGVKIEDDFKRVYPEGEALSHILGYIGAVDNNDLLRNPSLSLNDSKGKTGLEFYYDKELRGEDGETINYRNAKGELIGEKLLKKATPGYELYSTIDSGLQSYFYNALRSRLEFLGSKAGVGIALDPQNGEILALVNVPSFNNNKIEDRDLVDESKPLFNRAISGLYSPGSTIKPLVAFAALKENVITPDKQIFSPGYIDVPNPYNPDAPSRFLDWRPQGWVDLRSALARSSNVYFYEVGGGFDSQQGVGIERIKEYWEKFGLGDQTGIDLPSENSGFLPDPSLKEKSGRGIWRIGDTYNVAIGQGDLLVTPVELINYIATMANGGRMHRPFLAEKIVDSDGKIVKITNPEITRDYSSGNNAIFAEIKKGMVDGVTQWYGTSHLLADLPFPVAAKTGTAQINANTKTNALFVGYAPVDNPQIAILVLIENAREGSLNTVPVAKDVLRWYYENRLVNNH